MSLAFVACDTETPVEIIKPDAPVVVIPKDTTPVVVTPPIDSFRTVVKVPASLGVGDIELFFRQNPNPIKPDSSHLLGKIGVKGLDTSKYEVLLTYLDLYVTAHITPESKNEIKNYFLQEDLITPLFNKFESNESFWWYLNKYDGVKNNPLVTENGLEILIKKTNKIFPETIPGELTVAARLSLIKKNGEKIAWYEIKHARQYKPEIPLIRFEK